MGESKNKTVQMTLGDFMKESLLTRLRGPEGQAMLRGLSELITSQVMQVIAREMRAMAKETGGQVDVEQFLARFKPPIQ